ncbi:ABC transporter substrate-binding protein [Paenibacillus chitinolyticus]|uniref:ABC transporter substrate-binding protein n=1 Tax=Paenibacillus chitinolyticus TaxID=79263 RepID=A0A410WYY1_9BACL|nr:ABC transporter substrate-binding protein [Paenibacillus chitinolyticus]MCY9590372.1 ABC transporter substrate-binding protein [Paenibacillus chitinolyticus]MCY9596634.1 ABC transporter substrate-binding protein [Paenibacillus chitinolyticus]QAV19638.1 ABC transporter substrate-binding protein [Paenibacillus chitinolyticus]
MFSHQRFALYRLQAAATAVLLLAAVILSGCGGREDSAAGSTVPGTPNVQASDVSGTGTTKETAFKKISTVKGEIQIPVRPQRIVAEEYLGSLIALNVVPVGAPGLTLNNYYYKKALNGVADTGTYGKLSVERITGLEPDLIITGNAETYEQLSKIAPTLVIPYGTLKNTREELEYFGTLLGKETEAKSWLEDYDRRIAAAKSKVDAVLPADASFTIMESTDKSIWVYGDNFGRGGQPVYQALGRTPPAAISDELMKKQWAEISAEVLGRYAGDYIIMTANNKTAEDFRTDPVWSTLPAVKNGKLYVWPEERSWYYDPLAVLSQTEELAEWLVKTGK